MQKKILYLIIFLILVECAFSAEPNITKPVIPQGYYTENHTITAFSRIYDADADSLRANISINTSVGVNETQYISSIISFENNNSNGWTLINGKKLWTYQNTPSQLDSEGNTSFVGFNAEGISRTFNLSNYDFMLLDYYSATHHFFVYLNSTLIQTSAAGPKAVNNEYINLSGYGGNHTMYIRGDSLRVCGGGAVNCSNTVMYLDNVRFGAYFDNGIYNITSNTNVTTVFNIQSGIGVKPQDLFDVSNNFTVVFNISDSTGANTTQISNLMNISNRKPIITNVTLKPILATQNASLLDFDFFDPDDGHTNQSQFCRWYKNGTQIYSGGECELDTGNYSINDKLVAEVRATDSYNYSDYVNSTNLTVGDQKNPSLSNISIPENGYANVEYPIIIDCQDDLSDIVSVTVNITDTDGQRLIYSLDYYTGSSYRLLYTPPKAGRYYFTGARCIDSSYNENVTSFNFSFDVKSSQPSMGGPTSGTGGNEVIIETEIIIQKPENESLFLFKTLAGSGATDIVILPAQERKITLKLISQHDKELSIKIFCSDETVANLCNNTKIENEIVELKPSETKNIEITIKPPDEFTFGDTGKFNMIARLVAISSEGIPIESSEQKVVRIQETVSGYAYPVAWGYNLFGFYTPFSGLPIPKIFVFASIAGGLIILFYFLITKSSLVLTTLFFLFWLLTSVIEFIIF